MKRKLDIVKNKVGGEITTKIQIDQTKQLEKLDEVNQSLKDVWQVLNDKEEYNFDKLLDQIKTLHERLDFTPIISGLEKIDKNQSHLTNQKLKIQDFSRLLEAVEKNKPVPINLTKLEKAIIQVEQRIQESLVNDQGVEDYQPVRRVVKVGNRLVYDDQPTPSRGGGSGGGSSSGGLTNAELRASAIDVNATIDTSAVATSAKQSDGSQKTQIVDSGGEAATVTGGKLDVNASVDTTGLATSAKQDTGNTSLASIDGKITAVNTGAVVVASSALPSGAATAAKQPALGTAGTSSADVITVQGRAAMTPILTDGSATTQPVSGTVTANAGTGTMAVSNAGLTELAAAIDTEVQVDVVGALPAGNNNIGDVDVASSALPSGASTSAKQDTMIGHLDGVETLLTDIEADTDTLAVVGGGVEATAQRVTIANDSTGVLSVDDNGGSLTVDNAGLTELASAINSDKVDVNISSGNITGFATSAKQDTAQTSLDTIAGDTTAIQASVETIDNAISGSEMQVDVVAALPAGDNNIGNVDVVTLPSIPAGTNNIGDVDVLSLPATPAGTNLIGKTSASHETSTIYDGATALTPKFAIIDAASSGDNTLVAAVVGKKVRVLNLVLISSGTVNVRFESGAGGTALTGVMNLVASTGFAPGYSPIGHFETASNTLLNLELSGAVSVDGWLVYIEV